jgi:hypothetical protein
MKNQIYFTNKAGGLGCFVATKKGTNFDWRISPKEAARLMREHGYNLPFDIMCKEYGDDNDWVGMSPEDLNGPGEDREGLFDADYKTFEVYGAVGQP